MSNDQLPSTIPCRLDANLSRLDRQQLQSGVGDRQDLQLQQIIELKPAHWSPLILRGFYYFGTDPHYLHSNSAYRFIPRQDSALIVPLPFLPQEGEPLSIVLYRRELDGRIRTGYRWRQRQYFTGRIEMHSTSAVELIDQDHQGNIINYNLRYADLTRFEFILQRYPDYQTTYDLPLDLFRYGPGRVVINLDPPAISHLPIQFTRPEIFLTRVTTLPAEPGEWMISHDGSQLTVFLSQIAHPGRVTYCHTHPAELIFSKDYTITHGTITSPPVIETAELLGISDGAPYICLSTRYLPLLSHSTTHVLVETAGQTTTWEIVNDLSQAGSTDQVCTVDLDFGLIRFGDGIHGKIPPAGSRIGVVYTTTPLIQGEIRSDDFTGREVNLFPLSTSLHQGFLYLGQALDRLQQLVLTCDREEVHPQIFGPIFCGNDFTTLTCTALDPYGEPLPDIQVEFVTTPHGSLNQLPPGMSCFQHTLGDGSAQVIFYPPGNIIRLAKTIELYNEFNQPSDVYRTINQSNDALSCDTSDLNPNYLSEALTFLLVDDDQLNPYSPYHRRGGTMVLLYHWNESTNSFQPTNPSLLGQDFILYPKSLPTPTELPSLRKFVVAIPRLVSIYCRAIDPMSGREVRSNTITLLVKAPTFQIGPYTVQLPQQETPGAAVGAATYLTIDQRGQINTSFQLMPQSQGMCASIFQAMPELPPGYGVDFGESTQILMLPDFSEMVVTVPQAFGGYHLMKFRTSDNSLLSYRLLTNVAIYQETGVFDDYDEEYDDPDTPFYWHANLALDEQGKVYGVTSDGWGRIVKMDSSTWNIEGVSVIHPASNFTDKHPTFPEGAYKGIRRLMVSHNPQYPYLWGMCGVLSWTAGASRVYLINRNTMTNPYDEDDWGHAIPPPPGMADNGTFNCNYRSIPEGLAINHANGSAYILWSTTYNLDEVFLSCYNPATQSYTNVADITEYIHLPGYNVGDLTWGSNLGYDPISNRLVVKFDATYNNTGVTMIHFFDTNFNHLKTEIVAGYTTSSTENLNSIVLPYNSKFYLSSYRYGIEQLIYEVDCAAMTVKKIFSMPWNNNNYDCDGYRIVWVTEVVPRPQGGPCSFYTVIVPAETADSLLRELTDR